MTVVLEHHGAGRSDDGKVQFDAAKRWRVGGIEQCPHDVAFVPGCCMEQIDVAPPGDPGCAAVESPATVHRLGSRERRVRAQHVGERDSSPQRARGQVIGEPMGGRFGEVGRRSRPQVLRPDKRRRQAARRKRFDQSGDGLGLGRHRGSVHSGFGERAELFDRHAGAAIGLERPREQHVVGEKLCLLQQNSVGNCLHQKISEARIR